MTPWSLLTFLLLLLAESKDCDENEINVLEELMTELKVVLDIYILPFFLIWKQIVYLYSLNAEMTRQFGSTLW